MTRHHLFSALLVTAAAVSLFSSVFPLLVNNPFHVQGEQELQLALWLARQHIRTEWITGGVALLALALLWHTARRGAAILAALVFVSIGLDHVDIYSLLFHRMDRLEFDDAARSGLPPSAKVLAVKLTGAARAFPVLPLAYHHVVNDQLAGVPLAATW